MMKSVETKKRQNKEKFKVPKSAQDLIPFDTIYADGIFQNKNRFSKCYQYEDINYYNASSEERNEILIAYMEFINSFDPSAEVKVTTNNRKMNVDSFSKNVLLECKVPEWKEYYDHYNQNILDKNLENNNIIQERYITVTIYKKSYKEAKLTFSRITNDIIIKLGRIKSAVRELNCEERLQILHDFYRSNDEPMKFDMNDLSRKGHSFKDLICPVMPEFHNTYFKFNDKYGRVLYLKDYPSGLSENFVIDMCKFNKKFMFSHDFFSIPPREAIQEIRLKILGADRRIRDYRVKQNMNNNFGAEPPYEFVQQKRDLEHVLSDLLNGDQKLFMSNITIVHIADSLMELENDTDHLKSVANSYGCQIETVYFSYRQLQGLNTVLPISNNLLGTYRTLQSQSCAAFVQLRSQEIFQIHGIWMGQNYNTRNPIVCNKSCLKNCNSLTLGTSGSGKSFITKEELGYYILERGDDVIICDPEGEYDSIVKKFNGQIINITAKGKDHINAMDMNIGYGESDNPIADKSQFIMSLFEQLDPRGVALSAKERSIIDRCVYRVYKDAANKNNIPTLKNLYDALLETDMEEARDLAIRLEICVTGSFDTFGYETNVDMNNQLISFNINRLGKQQKSIGVLVITDAILNRVNENWAKGKITHVFIDEVHVLFSNKEGAVFFSSAWRQFRKRGAYPTGITQNISTLLNSEEGNAVISNSECLILLDQKAEDLEQLGRILNLSKDDLYFLTDSPKGRGILKYGSAMIRFENKLSEGPLYDLFTTDFNDENRAFRVK